ncbi:hypothetical protein [Pseudomonas sp. PH1b]|uniref:hypothetical protein n=1 Tax=Pseudomonas sp. PH1b TaxID=1397282 RepID=UPI0012FED082|nr:hypothetical protein [Pseudomonas sp. PH1b]
MMTPSGLRSLMNAADGFNDRWAGNPSRATEIFIRAWFNPGSAGAGRALAEAAGNICAGAATDVCALRR